MTDLSTQQGFPQLPSPLVDPRTGITTQPWYRFFIALWTRTGGGAGGTTFAPGFLADYAGGAAPSGWLPCDGAAVSRATYAALFAAIGTTWGAGDGSTTFNVPDLRGRDLLGAGTGSGLSARTLGQTGGAEAVTLATANLPAHNHGVSDPGHTHGFLPVAHTHTLTDPGHAHSVTDPTHTHGITDPTHSHTGAATASNGTAGADAVGATAGSTGASATGITVDAAATGVTVNANTTGVTADATAATGSVLPNSTGVTTQNTGSGTAVTVMNPFAVVTKLIKT